MEPEAGRTGYDLGPLMGFTEHVEMLDQGYPVSFR